MNASIRFKSLIKRMAFLIPCIPIGVYWFSWAFYRNYWFTTDPTAWYFLDSLSIFAGKTYVYVDHPGTPVHILGSILLALTHPFFGSNEEFIRYYIARPETFFILANAFLLAANLLTIGIFYKTATDTLTYERTLAGTALSLTYFAIHPAGFSSVTYWSHNSFNFIFGTLWLLWLFREVQTGKDLQPSKIALLGISVGIIVTTQLYLLAWLAGGIITVFVYTLRQGHGFRRSIMNALLMTGAGLTGIVLMLLPIYRELPRLLDWLGRLISRDGLYGSGSASLYSPQLLVEALRYWWQNIPIVMLILTILLVAFGTLVWFARSRPLFVIPAGDFALAFGLLAQMIVLLLVLGKMYYRIRYLLSVAAVLPVLLMLALKLLEQANLKNAHIQRTVYAALIISSLIFMAQEISVQQKRTLVERESAVERSKVVSQLAKVKQVAEEDVVTVYAFGTPFKCAGLLMANNWIRTFDSEIRERCPNQYAIYDFAYDVELNVPHSITPIEQIEWDLVVWPGNGSNLPEYLASVGAQNIPKKWHIKRSKWFYIHREEAGN